LFRLRFRDAAYLEQRKSTLDIGDRKAEASEWDCLRDLSNIIIPNVDMEIVSP